MDILDIRLMDFPYERWQKKYDKLLQNPYIRKKYDRDKRLAEKFKYVTEHFKVELTRRGNVLDIGPGPGEFMEVCRYMGCQPVGIDALEGESQMGDPYLRLSKLMVERQRLDVLYEGVDHMMNKGGFPFLSSNFDIINSQGSIEMVFRNYMMGPAFETHMDAKKMSWVIDKKLRERMLLFIGECYRILMPGGVLLIFGNGCKNMSAYDKLIQHTVDKVDGLRMSSMKSQRLHKMVKIQ